MTIAAGFKTHEGIVLCADTLESVTGLSKRHVPKLKFSKAGPRLYADGSKHERASVAFCGATDNGPFVDALVERCMEASWDGVGVDGTSERIISTIEQVYKKYGKIFQHGQCPYAELIFGVALDGERRLFAADGPVVNEVDDYAARGAGYYLANFLAERMHSLSLSLYQLLILAAYILFQTKEHVDGCGGDSHIAILGQENQCGMIHQPRIRAIEELVKSIDRSTARSILQFADLTNQQDDVAREIQLLASDIAEARGRGALAVNKMNDEYISLAEIISAHEATQKDEFGFRRKSPMPPQQSETPAPQPPESSKPEKSGQPPSQG